jgi:excisionase family DNA binding protein
MNHFQRQPLMTIEEVAAYTGLSVHTLYAMVSHRRIPYVKVGRLVRFHPGDLDDWLLSHSVRPVSPERL